MKPTICRMCNEKFKPAGEEHICQPCITELDALEAAWRHDNWGTKKPSTTTEEEQEEHAT